MYFKFAQNQKQLKLLVEHKVLVHEGVSKGYRQRKGGTVKMFSRTVTLLDGAARFLIGLCGGDRNTECWEFLSHSKKSLTSISLMAASLREIIEDVKEEFIRKPLSAITSRECGSRHECR